MVLRTLCSTLDSSLAPLFPTLLPSDSCDVEETGYSVWDISYSNINGTLSVSYRSQLQYTLTNMSRGAVMHAKFVVLGGPGRTILRRSIWLRGEGSEDKHQLLKSQQHHSLLLSYIYLFIHLLLNSMSEDRPLDVATWLSELSSSPSASTDSPTPDTPSNTYSPTQNHPSKTSQKCKRLGDTHFGLTQQHTESRQPLTHTALTELSLNIMNTPSPSVQKRGGKKFKVSELQWPLNHLIAMLTNLFAFSISSPRKQTQASTPTKPPHVLLQLLLVNPLALSKRLTKPACAWLQQSKACFSKMKTRMKNTRSSKHT